MSAEAAIFIHTETDNLSISPERPSISQLGLRLRAIRQQYLYEGDKLYTREESQMEQAESRRNKSEE